MENEIWKDVKEYEAVLQVSDLGNARTKDRYVINSNGVKIFRKGINKKAKLTLGYYQIQLNQKGKNICFMLHRLIAETFIENPNKLPLVNHIDGNKLNNKIANLEWTTYSDNVKHAYEENFNTEWKNRRKPVNQFSLEKKFIAEFESARDASRKTGVRLSGIVNVCNKVHKSAGGFYWEWLYSEDIIKRNNSQYNLDDLDNEEWKYINDTNEMYMISNMGRLKSIRWNKLLKPSLDKKSGYMKCGIKCTDKKDIF